MKTVPTYRPEKESMVAELRQAVERSPFAFIFEYRGLTVERSTELRRRLRPARARLRVVPNRLLYQATKDLPAAAWKPVLRGPTLLVTGEGDAVETAKILIQFGKETQMVSPKGGVLGARVLTPADVEALSQLPPKPVLIGQLVGVLAAPLRGLVTVLGGTMSGLVRALKALEEKKASGAPSA